MPKARGYCCCPGATGQKDGICEVNLSNSGIKMSGECIKSSVIVKTVHESYPSGSVRHGLQEKLGLQEEYRPGGEGESICAGAGSRDMPLKNPGSTIEIDPEIPNTCCHGKLYPSLHFCLPELESDEMRTEQSRRRMCCEQKAESTLPAVALAVERGEDPC